MNPKTNPNPRWVSLSQASRRLGISRPTLYRYLELWPGVLEVTPGRNGEASKVPASQVEDFFDRLLEITRAGRLSDGDPEGPREKGTLKRRSTLPSYGRGTRVDRALDQIKTARDRAKKGL